MSLKMFQDPKTGGLEKSPLIRMFWEVPSLTNLTLSIKRPKSSEMPAPENWRAFLPGWTVMARLTVFQM